MARLPRLVVPGHAHYLVLRSGQALVVDDEDRRQFLAVLREAVHAQRLAINAYALLDDEFHLLLVPPTGDALAAAVQTLGRRYAAGFNRRHARRGALWGGRYRAGIIEAGAHSLDCMCLIDTLAVSRGLAAAPQDFRWSSAAHRLGQRHDSLLAEPAEFWRLGNTPFEREAAYRARLDSGIGAAAAAELQHAALNGWVLGSAAYVAELASVVGRPMRPRPRGRPARRRANDR